MLGMLSSSSTMSRSSAGQLTGINNQAGCLLGVNGAAFCCRHLFSFTISADWWHSGSRGFGILLGDQFLSAGTLRESRHSTALGQGCSPSPPSLCSSRPKTTHRDHRASPARPSSSGGSELLLQSLQSRAP